MRFVCDRNANALHWHSERNARIFSAQCDKINPKMRSHFVISAIFLSCVDIKKCNIVKNYKKLNGLFITKIRYAFALRMHSDRIALAMLLK